MIQELVYVSESEDKKETSKNPYGKKVMFMFVKKFCDCAGIKIEGTFDATAWSKPLAAIYRHFGRDAKKTMDYIEQAVNYFEEKNLSYTPFTLQKNLLMLDKWINKDDKFNSPLYE